MPVLRDRNCWKMAGSSDMKIVADTNIPFAKECFFSLGEVVLCPGREMDSDLIKNADCLLVRSVTKVDSRLLKGSSVRFVGTATIGIDHVDVDYLGKNNIAFASAPGSNANSVAEYVVTSLLLLGGKYGFELQGRSIGIVGVGNVGSKVAKKCEALGMKVILNDPPLQRQTSDAKYRPIEELYDCDVITLHTPLTFEGQDKTFHLADEEFFSKLKNGCAFLNTSRGAVVDTSAVKSFIESGKSKACVLDVWESEPTIDMQLLELVDIATPHIAGYSYDGKVAGMVMLYDAVCECFGLDAKFTVDSFLPAAIVPELVINTSGDNEQDVLADAVKKIYDIKADDERLRAILAERPQEHGKYFSLLRKNYPIRREFQNTKIIIEGDQNSLANKFDGIGFTLAR